jgi:hypothetical protein
MLLLTGRCLPLGPQVQHKTAKSNKLADYGCSLVFTLQPVGLPVALWSLVPAQTHLVCVLCVCCDVRSGCQSGAWVAMYQS